MCYFVQYNAVVAQTTLLFFFLASQKKWLQYSTWHNVYIVVKFKQLLNAFFSFDFSIFINLHYSVSSVGRGWMLGMYFN